MRKILGKADFRGRAASIPIRNGAHSGKLPWAGVLAVMVTLVLLLGGCPQPDGGGGTSAYTVSFEANGGTPAPQSQTVSEGGKITEPPVMIRGNYTFIGWYREAALANLWDFETDTVTGGNITLYARWVDDNHWAITWELNGGAWFGTPPANEVGKGGTITEPAAPAKAGLSFFGWYKEAGLTNRWIFDTDTVTGNITLYARWTLPPGTQTSYTGDGIAFKTVYVPGGIAFPTGTDDNGTPATVADAYEIGETEVTYELWYAVRSWAENYRGYTFYDNPGREGSSGSTQNTMPGTNRQEPVTMVNWYDAVIWLNALTEWVNVKTGSSFTPVYYYESACTTVARDSTDASAYVKSGATGFRLPSSNEWELAARWRGSDTGNTVSGYTDPYFTKGNSASGAAADYNDAAASGAVAWYYNSTDFPGGTRKTQAVKGKIANGLGLYDMSGNVTEWCNDRFLIVRFFRGGSWNSAAGHLQVGNEFSTNFSSSRSNHFGFRPARTAN